MYFFLYIIPLLNCIFNNIIKITIKIKGWQEKSGQSLNFSYFPIFVVHRICIY